MLEWHGSWRLQPNLPRRPLVPEGNGPGTGSARAGAGEPRGPYSESNVYVSTFRENARSAWPQLRLPL